MTMKNCPHGQGFTHPENSQADISVINFEGAKQALDSEDHELWRKYQHDFLVGVAMNSNQTKSAPCMGRFCERIAVVCCANTGNNIRPAGSG